MNICRSVEHSIALGQFSLEFQTGAHHGTNSSSCLLKEGYNVDCPASATRAPIFIERVLAVVFL